MENKEVVKYDLIMIITFITTKYIFNLLDSLTKNERLQLLIILIPQNYDFIGYQNDKYKKLNLKIIDGCGVFGVSNARNLGLNFLAKNHQIEGNFVMFPDDDTTFDTCFFEKFLDTIKLDRNYVIPIYNEGTMIPYKKFKLKNEFKLKKKDFKYSGAPNMILRYSIIKNGVFFDERLGPGSIFGSSEDVDFYFKCCKLAPFIFCTEVYNFHPAKWEKYNQMSYDDIIKRFRNYSAGYIFVMLKYKRYFDLIPLLSRTIGAAILNLFKGNWKLFKAYFYQFFIRISLIYKLAMATQSEQDVKN